MDPRLAPRIAGLGAPAHARVVRAPGRVNLIGDHTDYCEGLVLPMAIGRDCLVAATPTDEGRVRARSLELAGVVDVAADGSDDPQTVEPSWGRFVAGAIAAMAERGATVDGLDLAVTSTVPPGSGLSSSSALSVALTLAIADAAGVLLATDEAARAALDGEVRATGVPGGLMDQLCSLLGVVDHALVIDCRSLTAEPIPIPRSLGVVVVHSGLHRTLVDSAYAERRAECEATARRLGVHALRDATAHDVHDDPRARHVVSENARVEAFATALRTGDVDTLGPLMLASHASLRDDFEVSTPELDVLVDLLVEHGAYGARLTGAGFGGCVVALVQRNHADDLVARVVPRYVAATGREPSAFSVRASAGAAVVGPSPTPPQ